MSKKDEGIKNASARKKALEKIKSMRGRKITPADLFDLVIAIGQFLGFIDEDEKVK